MTKDRFKRLISKVISLLPESYLFNQLWLKLFYMIKMREKIDFDNLETLNQKIQKMKLEAHDELSTIITDKVLAKDYIARKIGDEYVVPNFYVSDDLEMIRADIFPSCDVVFKVNHDCSGGIVIRGIENNMFNIKGVESDIGDLDSNNSVESNLNYLREFARRRFGYNHFYLTKESQYKNIKKKFLIEKLLTNDDGSLPNDYKFHCFSGKVEFIYVSAERDSGNYRKIYYPDWTEAPFTWTTLGKEHKFIGKDIPKPKRLSDMIKLAEKLSEDFEYIRIDIYATEKGLFIGELTQHQGSGFEPILPKMYDREFGKLIK